MKRSKKGVTMVEAVVAMTLIALVSFSAINLSLTSTTSIAESINMFSVINDISNIKTLYEYSDSESNFWSKMYSMDWSIMNIGNGKYRITRSLYYIELEVNYSKIIGDFTAKAYVKSTNELMYSYKYNV